MLAIVLGLISAVLLAAGTVLEQRAASERPPGDVLKLRLIFGLARDRRWLLGLALAYASFPLQATAFHFGRLSVVQPVISLNVALVIPMGWLLLRRHTSRAEVSAAAIVAAGLGAFLFFADPSGGKAQASVRAWAVAVGIILAIGLPLLVAGLRTRASRRAALFGAVSGMLFGIVAALVKGTVEQFEQGIHGPFLDWHLYALVSVAAASFLIEQSAYQTGALGPSAAATKSVDPVTAIVLGIFLLDEDLAGGALRHSFAAISLAIAVGGIVALARAHDTHQTNTRLAAIARRRPGGAASPAP